MSDKTCPFCSAPLEDAYLYLRGIFGALHYATTPDVPWLSRSGLTQIDLDAISEKGTGTQAIVRALRCDSCGSISFRSRP